MTKRMNTWTVSNTFETQICVPATAVPAALRAAIDAHYPGETPLSDTDEIPDLVVVVEFEGGWFQPGRYCGKPEDCYPDEGEDPEIVGVRLTEEGFDEVDVLRGLPKKTVHALVSEAWREIERRAKDYDHDGGDL